MKKPHIQIVVFILLVGLFVSCETLALEGDESSSSIIGNSAKQKESPEAKFLGIWVFSDKNFGMTTKELGIEGWPSDLSFKLAFSFGPNSTGTLSIIAAAYGTEIEEEREFFWYVDSIYNKLVNVVMKDNTAESYALLYENELFLTMNDKDIGTLFFAKKQQETI